MADLLQAAVNDAFRRQILTHPLSGSSPKDYPVIRYADDTMIMLACPQQSKTKKTDSHDYATFVGLCINYIYNLYILAWLFYNLHIRRIIQEDQKRLIDIFLKSLWLKWLI